MHDRTTSAAGCWTHPSASLTRPGFFRPGELAELRTIGSVRYVEAGTLVAAAGSIATHVQIVGGGELELMARQEGGRATVALVRTGGVIMDVPLLLGTPMLFDALASQGSEIISLSRQRWTQLLASSPSLSLRWMTSIARRLDDDLRRLIVITSRSLVSQVAYLLLDLAEPGTGGQREVQLSHTTMAHLLGARRQSITRVIAQLRQDDLVSTSYGSTILLDERGLRDVMGTAPWTQPVVESDLVGSLGQDSRRARDVDVGPSGGDLPWSGRVVAVQGDRSAARAGPADGRERGHRRHARPACANPAHRSRECSRGLKPPVSSSDRAM